MAVKGDDNVIYANFGTRKRVSTPDEVNHVDRSGRILSTTASRIAAFTSHGADRGRITRGRQYAEGGHVVGLEVRNGAIHGRVAGSQNEPFAVLIQLPYRNNDDIASWPPSLPAPPIPWPMRARACFPTPPWTPSLPPKPKTSA